MLLLSKLNSQRGQTLLLVIGLIAVVSAIVLEVRHRLDQKKKSRRQAVIREHAGLVMQNFATRLQNPETCTDILAGEFVTPGDRADVVLRYVIDDNLVPETKALGPGTKVAEGLTLTALKLQTPSAEDMRTEILDDNGVATALVRYPAYLQVEFADDSGRIVTLNRSTRLRADGTKEMEVGIPFYVWASSLDKQILSCFGRNSAGALCNDLGGYFIPNHKPYHLSCRQSLKTERRLASGLTPRGTCRIGGLHNKASACHKKLGTSFAANLVQQTRDRFSPKMPDQYLCELCQ